MKTLKNNMILVLVIAGLLSAITSCSNQNDNGITPNKKPGSDTVVINSMQFSPATLKVDIGDTVTWINKDLVDHNVKDTINHLFYSDTLKNEQSYRWIVTGGARYICTIHPTMNGEIVISNN